MQFSAADFQPLARQSPAEAEVLRAELPLWRVLLSDLRACIALFVVVALVLMAAVGPWLWPQDHARQWLSQVSSGPVGARQVDVVADEPLAAEPLQALVEPVVLRATTTSVQLAWPAVAAADRYRIYRSERGPGQGPGIPLAEVERPFYDDRLQLAERDYRYTIVALRRGLEVGQPLVLSVRPRLTVGEFEARLLGLSIEDGQVWLPAHPLGTDSLGRDMLSRVIHGARTSMLVGLTAPLLFITLGAFYGAAAGLLGGAVDNILMRVADFVVALPFLLFMILFRIALGIESGESGLFPMVLAMVLLSWPSAARLVRGQVLQLRGSAFVLSARMAGAGNGYLIRRHLLPNVLPLLLVVLSFAIPQAIFTEALLSFIGMGVVPPTPSWGSLCNEGIRSMLTHPHELIVPAVAISIAVLSFNVLGDALRDAMDVQVRRQLR